VVIALTPAALESQWVEKETEVAIARERKGQIEVFPLDLKHCQVPLLLSSYQMVSFRRDYDAGLRELHTVLGLTATQPVRLEEPELAAPKKMADPIRNWRRLRLPLAVFALLGLALVLGAVVLGLTGAGGEETTPTSKPPFVASLRDTWARLADDMMMVYVPGGTFQMGCTQDEVDAALDQCVSALGSERCEPGKYDDETPSHSVTLDSFWIDKYEVTNAQYARCVADGSCEPPSRSSTESRPGYYGDSQYDDYPVIWIAWLDADAYCQWAGGRLPTEAEWEYAARGQDRTIYPWGDDPPSDTLLNYGWNVGDTAQVGSYPGGASWVGAMDMAGNVWEWVYDRYAEDYYAQSPAQNPTGPATGYENVHRGGSFSRDLISVRNANRSSNPPNFDYWNIGFRCVIAPNPLPTPEASAPASTPTATSLTLTDTPLPPTDKPTHGLSTPTSTASLHQTWTRRADTIEMVYVPGGTFQMGSTQGLAD
jgi:formylglycine-generating enzyme required for sulfatase activity